MANNNVSLIFVAITVVLLLTLYFHNKLMYIERHFKKQGAHGAPQHNTYLTKVDVDKRVSEVDLNQDTGRKQMRVLKTDPTYPAYSTNPAFPYSDLRLPFQVIGGGRRMIPTYGGSQIPIANPTLPVDISSANIAPVNIYQPDMTDSFRQVGVIMKVFGQDNQMLPLFGREKWPNSNKWLYYTNIGKQLVSLPVKSAQHPGYEFELQNNDEVIIKGVPGKYRVTTYDTDGTDYIPINV